MEMRISKGYYLSTTNRKVIAMMRKEKKMIMKSSNGSKTYQTLAKRSNGEFDLMTGSQIGQMKGEPQMEYEKYTLLDS